MTKTKTTTLSEQSTNQSYTELRLRSALHPLPPEKTGEFSSAVAELHALQESRLVVLLRRGVEAATHPTVVPRPAGEEVCHQGE